MKYLTNLNLLKLLILTLSITFALNLNEYRVHKSELIGESIGSELALYKEIPPKRISYIQPMVKSSQRGFKRRIAYDRQSTNVVVIPATHKEFSYINWILNHNRF